MSSIPKIIDGALATDSRGSVRFVNDFDFSLVKRFYQVENSDLTTIRAFHGHMQEAKYVYVSRGRILLCIVPPSDSHAPSKNALVQKYFLSSKTPQVLYIPPAFANGFRSLTSDACVLFFSTSTLLESKADDFRFDPYYWGDVWQEEK